MVKFQLYMCCMVDKAHSEVICSSFTPPETLPPQCSAYWKGFHVDGTVVNSKTPFEMDELTSEDLVYWKGRVDGLKREEMRARRKKGPAPCTLRPPERVVTYERSF